MRQLLLIAFLCLAPRIAEATETCLAYPYVDDSSAESRSLVKLFARLEPVLEEFQPFSDALEKLQPDLCLADRLDGALAALEVESNRFVLSRDASEDLRLGVMLHELRHLDQFARGHCPSTDVSMKENARATWAMEADASAISLLAAWYLRKQGDPGPWEALKGWPLQADIAERFEAAMQRSDDPAIAVSEAFTQWYDSDRRLETYYIASCSAYLDRLDATNALPTYDLLPGDFFDTLCILPSGPTFDCEEPENAQR